jgi:hypothetical protein
MHARPGTNFKGRVRKYEGEMVLEKALNADGLDVEDHAVGSRAVEAQDGRFGWESHLVSAGPLLGVF